MILNAIHWNVDPIAIHIGSGGLRWYSLGFLLAFGFGYWILSRIFKREKVDSRYLDSLVIYIFLAVLIGARLGHCLFYDFGYYFTAEHWVEIFWPFSHGHFVGYQGLASHGAAIAILISLWLYWRKYSMNPVWILDRIVIVVALGGAFIRIGNLFNSEIYGTATTLPWGFIFERNGEVLPKHPTGLYEASSYLLIFAVSLWYYLHKKGQFRTGSIFGWWLVALFGARFLIEFVKTNGVIEGSALLKGQWLSIPFIVGGLVIAWLAYKQKLPQGAFPKGENQTIVAKWKAKDDEEKRKMEERRKRIEAKKKELEKAKEAKNRNNVSRKK